MRVYRWDIYFNGRYIYHIYFQGPPGVTEDDMEVNVLDNLCSLKDIDLPDGHSAMNDGYHAYRRGVEK